MPLQTQWSRNTAQGYHFLQNPFEYIRKILVSIVSRVSVIQVFALPRPQMCQQQRIWCSYNCWPLPHLAFWFLCKVQLEHHFRRGSCKILVRLRENFKAIAAPSIVKINCFAVTRWYFVVEPTLPQRLIRATFWDLQRKSSTAMFTNFERVFDYGSS